MRAQTDVLRESDTARAGLAAELAHTDRLVLLGDVLELRNGPIRGALTAAQPVLERLLDNRQPDRLQLAALQALDRHTAKDVGTVIVAAWPGMTPKLRKASRTVATETARATAGRSGSARPSSR